MIELITTIIHFYKTPIILIDILLLCSAYPVYQFGQKHVKYYESKSVIAKILGTWNILSFYIIKWITYMIPIYLMVHDPFQNNSENTIFSDTIPVIIAAMLLCVTSAIYKNIQSPTKENS